MIVAILLLDSGILLWIAFTLYKKQDDLVRSFYWPALIAKLLAGLSVGWLYFSYYGQGDTISYWEDGKRVSDVIMSNPLGSLKFYWNEDASPVIVEGLNNLKPRSLFFVKISGLIALVSGSNYWMMSIIISFFSFLGSWYIFTKTISFFPGSRIASAVAFLFYPSIVFWSSGLIKESIGLAALFFLAGVFLTISNKQRVSLWEWVVTILSIWIGWNLKYYWLGVFIPVAVTSALIIMLKRRFQVLAQYDVAVWLGLFIVVFLIVTSIHPNFYPARFLEVIIQNNQEFMTLTDPVNAIHYRDLNASLSSMVLNSPQAFIAGLFRPFFWEGHNFISYAAGVENFIFLLLALMALPALKGFFKSRDRLLGLAIGSYSFLLAIFLALSTPNFGTLSRYKIGFLPFLVFLIVYKNPFIVKWSQAKSSLAGS